MLVGDRAGALRRSAGRGFTLLELVVVVLILALAAAFVAPNISRGLRSTAVRQAVRQTAGVLTALRRQAVREGVVRELTVENGERGGELVWEGGRLELPEQARITKVSGGWQDADGAVHVLFYPSGGGTGVDLVVEGSTGDGPVFVVSANPLLGTVKIERLEEQ